MKKVGVEEEEEKTKKLDTKDNRKVSSPLSSFFFFLHPTLRSPPCPIHHSSVRKAILPSCM